jgi:hypothetical protein
MNLKHTSSPLPAGLSARPYCLKVSAAALTTTAIIAVLTIAKAVGDDCNSFPNGNPYSTAVPCRNATCADWSNAGIGKPKPTCLQPNGLAITKVTVTITETAWSLCTESSSKSACNESEQSCATYAMYGDNNCTVLCLIADSLPKYCKGP